MEEVNGAGAAPENGSAPEGAAQSDLPEAGQSAARKRSRWAAGEEGAAEGAAEVVAPEGAQEAPKKRKSKVLSPHRSAEAHLLAGVGVWRWLLLLLPLLHRVDPEVKAKRAGRSGARADSWAGRVQVRRNCVPWRMRRVALHPSGGNGCAEPAVDRGSGGPRKRPTLLTWRPRPTPPG